MPLNDLTAAQELCPSLEYKIIQTHSAKNNYVVTLKPYQNIAGRRKSLYIGTLVVSSPADVALVGFVFFVK